VRFVYKNYPLSSHEHSEIAARGAVAAGNQGKFWEMHDSLFANQETGLDHEEVLKLAKEVGVDEKKFLADWDSEATADSVNADRKQAEKLELRGTPMIYINDWIELEIEQRTGKNVTALPVASAAPAGAGSAAPVPPASGAPAGSAHPGPASTSKKP
jgi:protein-disulfide isomerase